MGEMIMNESGIAQSLDALVVDGTRPREIVAPTSSQETAEVLREAGGKGRGVIPAGNGTKLHIGNPPTRYDLALSTRGMTQLVDLDPENLTVTVQAGMNFAELQRIVGEKRQFVPIDPPSTDRATVGGVTAARSCGPRRFAWKSPRDIILGMEVALANGEVVKVGGKVVKNVAGYDVTKLFVGSFGSLGVITAVTLKTMALSETNATISGSVASLTSLRNAASQLLDSHLMPTAIVGMNGAAAARIGVGNRAALVVTFEGLERAVTRQTTETRDLMDAHGVQNLGIATDSTRIWQQVADFAVPPCSPQQPGEPATVRAVVKCALPLTEMSEFMQQTEQMAEEAGLEAEVVGWLGTGTVYVRAACDVSHNTKLPGFAQRIAADAQERQGHCVAEYLPPETKHAIDVWACLPREQTRSQDDFEYTRKIKEQMDPHSTLSPGRWLGRL